MEWLGDELGQARSLIDLGWLIHDDRQLEAAEDAASRAIDLLPEKGQQSSLGSWVCDRHRVLSHIRARRRRQVRGRAPSRTWPSAHTAWLVGRSRRPSFGINNVGLKMQNPIQRRPDDSSSESAVTLEEMDDLVTIMVSSSKQRYLSCLLSMSLNSNDGSDTCFRYFGCILLQVTDISPPPAEFLKIANTSLHPYIARISSPCLPTSCAIMPRCTYACLVSIHHGSDTCFPQSQAYRSLTSQLEGFLVRLSGHSSWGK